ncbi:MFS transporter [Limibaculum sp. M0105]|uniref:MFS transporter n=1 Tax=Thermohalobaculum xanthum TaxID=2753746 RepID=A0A8J7SDP6_9RHOB|nr:MFS transporter [Thermohalobaculum xanthum]MBK0399358.1 MFS transporter [Thermohalobaculum xanthum]
MRAVLKTSWPLLIGMFLLMIGNGMQGTVLGIRGGLEGFDATTMGLVMSGYFLGFLGGARLTPVMLRRVGHVRVFAALGSMISAALVIYGAIVDPIAWTLMRVLVGFCYSGVYVVAESWLNNQATNETRGRALSAYLIVQMLGIIAAQGLLNTADAAGYELFVIMSVAVSISFAPMLLSAGPTPVFETTRTMSLGRLYQSSPLGCVGTFLLGAIFACQFGMAPVYATLRGMTTAEISIFVGAFYVGGLVLQYPIGWLSDRMDRRHLIAVVTAIGAAAAFLALVAGGSFIWLVIAATLIGGTSNPLYSLLIAHTNDFLAPEDMAAASGGLIVLNGIGAAGTPILVGYLMRDFGETAFPLFLGAVMSTMTVYALYRMTKRRAKPATETVPISPITLAATPVAGEIAQEAAVEQIEAAGEGDQAQVGAT